MADSPDLSVLVGEGGESKGERPSSGERRGGVPARIPPWKEREGELWEVKYVSRWKEEERGRMLLGRGRVPVCLVSSPLTTTSDKQQHKTKGE
jgi:hypothetical protein